MAQFGRPSTDTTNQSYTDQAGGSANIFQSIDEVTADDADFIQSPLVPVSNVYVTKLTAVGDPLLSTGHVVRYRYQKDNAGGAQIDMTVQLRQGYVSEATQGTLIHSESVPNIPNGYTSGSFTLTGVEADSITDYTSLFLRFVMNQV